MTERDKQIVSEMIEAAVSTAMKDCPHACAARKQRAGWARGNVLRQMLRLPPMERSDAILTMTGPDRERVFGSMYNLESAIAAVSGLTNDAREIAMASLPPSVSGRVRTWMEYWLVPYVSARAIGKAGRTSFCQMDDSLATRFARAGFGLQCHGGSHGQWLYRGTLLEDLSVYTVDAWKTLLEVDLDLATLVNNGHVKVTELSEAESRAMMHETILNPPHPAMFVLPGGGMNLGDDLISSVVEAWSRETFPILSRVRPQPARPATEPDHSTPTLTLTDQGT